MKKILKGDEVRVMLGKDRGKSGKIERVLAKEGKVFVAGANVSKRHLRKQGQIEGGILDIVKPIDISNVSLVCPECKKTTRVGIRVEGDTKMRICKKCGKEIKKGSSR